MSIAVGRQVPDAVVFRLAADGPEAISMRDLAAGRRIAVFGVPGAFTRTCSARHLPGFVAQADVLKSKGIDEIVCLAVNDVFVLAAWSREHDADGRVTMISDGALNFTRAAGLETDMSDRGFGVRCRRFAMVVDDGEITHLYLEQPGAFGETSAERMLEDL